VVALSANLSLRFRRPVVRQKSAARVSQTRLGAGSCVSGRNLFFSEPVQKEIGSANIDSWPRWWNESQWEFP